MGDDTELLGVTIRGPGEPEVAVVGGVHGNETGGVRAVRRLREADLDLQRGVAFVTHEVREFRFDDGIVRVLFETFVSIFLAVDEPKPEPEQRI